MRQHRRPRATAKLLRVCFTDTRYCYFRCSGHASSPAARSAACRATRPYRYARKLEFSVYSLSLRRVQSYMIVYTRVPDPPRPRRPRARARGAAGRAPGVGPPTQTRSAPRPARDAPVPNSRVVRPARPRAACVRPTDAPGRAAAASDRVALNLLKRRQARHPRRGACAGCRLALGAPPVRRNAGRAVCPGGVCVRLRLQPSAISRAISHTRRQRTVTHAHDSRDTIAYSDT
jgi:hypothetical protein